jgi:hypothetical protein
MSELIDRIEAAARLAVDETARITDRLEAIDEVLMWAGRAHVRRALARHIRITAGCLHDRDGDCQCDAWEAVLALRRDRPDVLNWAPDVWPDGMDWAPGDPT